MQNAESQTVPLEVYLKALAELEALKQRLAWLERQIFGRKSEQYVPDEVLTAQLKLGFEPQQETEQVDLTVRQLVASYEREVVPKEEKKSEHQGRVAIPAHLERVEEVIEPEEDVSDMVCIGKDLTERLEYTPPKIWVHVTVRYKYARKTENNDSDGGMIVQAPAVEHPLGRSKAGVSLVANILMSKYVEHLPLYRLIARFARSGLKIPPSTMGQWVKSGAQPLEILYQAYEKIVFKSFYLQMDETKIPVLEDGKGKTHLGYLWATFDPVRKLPFFTYQPGRDHKGPAKLLQRFAGVLQCDGYPVYETLGAKLDRIILMNCLAHIRRKFFEAQSNDQQRAHTVLTLIKILYHVEEKARKQGLNAEQRLQLRLKESKEVFDTLGAWLLKEYDKVTPSSAIGKAIYYALQRWKNMRVFLTDGRVEIDNNLVENIIRPVAIGRKNYLFAGSHEAAQRTAMFYTFFAACKHHGIDPEIWLNDVLNRIGDHKVSQLEELMPHRWKPAGAGK
jgi:transposase